MSDGKKAAKPAAKSPAKQQAKKEAPQKAVDKPAEKRDAKQQTAHDKHEQEVRELHEENVRRWAEYRPSEVHAEIETESGKPIELHAAGGQVFLNSHGEKTLSRDDLINLRKQVEAAFQVVS